MKAPKSKQEKIERFLELISQATKNAPPFGGVRESRGKEQRPIAVKDVDGDRLRPCGAEEEFGGDYHGIARVWDFFDNERDETILAAALEAFADAAEKAFEDLERRYSEFGECLGDCTKVWRFPPGSGFTGDWGFELNWTRLHTTSVRQGTRYRVDLGLQFGFRIGCYKPGDVSAPFQEYLEPPDADDLLSLLEVALARAGEETIGELTDD